MRRSMHILQELEMDFYDIAESFKIEAIIKNERVVGWRVLLVSKCIRNSRELKPADKNMKAKVNFPRGTREVHKGHLIASMFKKYLLVKGFNFYKNNPNNIFPQYKISNCGNDGILGQLQFEQRVDNYLKKIMTVKFYMKLKLNLMN